jgi:hypothetical protein
VIRWISSQYSAPTTAAPSVAGDDDDCDLDLGDADDIDLDAEEYDDNEHSDESKIDCPVTQVSSQDDAVPSSAFHTHSLSIDISSPVVDSSSASTTSASNASALQLTSSSASIVAETVTTPSIRSTARNSHSGIKTPSASALVTPNSTRPRRRLSVSIAMTPSTMQSQYLG